MNTSKPSSITVEEAVARMINLDYIPTGFTLLEMTAAFHEEAEVAYENARIDRLRESPVRATRARPTGRAHPSRSARGRAGAALLPRVLAQVRRGELGRAKQQQDHSRQRQPPRPGIAVGVKDRNSVGHGDSCVVWFDVPVLPGCRREPWASGWGPMLFGITSWEEGT